MKTVRITLEANSLEMYETLKEHGDKVQEILTAPVISMLLGKRVDEKERLRLSMLKITVVKQEYIDEPVLSHEPSGLEGKPNVSGDQT